MVPVKIGSLPVLVALLGFGCAPPSGGPAKGAVLYTNCTPCHGEDGAGNTEITVPAIAGQEAVYVATQLRNFKTKVRGGHAADKNGLRMRPMAQVMESEADVVAVAEYVASLKPVVPKVTVKGNAKKGAAHFAACAACHAADGSGSPALKAPSLRNTNDWYLLMQLRNFKSGARGASPKDVGGAQMRPFSLTLPDDQAMRDVIAYITSLSRKESR
jgi:uncharacterized protein